MLKCDVKYEYNFEREKKDEEDRILVLTLS